MLMEQESIFDIMVATDAANSNVVIIHIKGNLSFTTVPIAYEKTRDCFKQGQHVQVDLNEVQRADSAAMALILEWYRLAREHNGRITLNNIPTMLKKIASFSDLEELVVY